MNPDLRAIEAALLGEPCDPSNLSPEAASVVLPLVRRVVQERDDGRHEIDMLRRERHAERQRVEERDQEVTRLRAALEEARLTLAAEQSLLRRAISTIHIGRRRAPLWVHVRDVFMHGSTLSQDLCRRLGYDPDQEVGGRKSAAMLAADKALFESRRTRCLTKARQLQSDGVILYPPNGTHLQTPAIMIDRLSDPDLTEAVLAIYEKVLLS